MLRKHSHARMLVAAFVALVLAATVFAGGVAVGSAGGAQPGGTEPSASPAVALPSWFIPIWDSYGRNPEITPWFDFASLYAGSIPTGALLAPTSLPHGTAVATGPQGPLPLR